jgi:hypothetical protein
MDLTSFSDQQAHCYLQYGRILTKEAKKMVQHNSVQRRSAMTIGERREQQLIDVKLKFHRVKNLW